MMFTKPKFWDQKVGFSAIILFPFSLLYLLVIFFKKKITSVKKLNIPIICVGNIYIGGTGKTPISIFLANEIKKLKKNPVIIRKYYKNHHDEYELIRNNTEDLILNRNRLHGLQKAEKLNYYIAILDDVLQDYNIKKNFNIACFNENQLAGNGLLVPSGPLRESLSALKNIDVIIINGEKNEVFEEALSFNKI